jgi:hypothetical protein
MPKTETLQKSQLFAKNSKIWRSSGLNATFLLAIMAVAASMALSRRYFSLAASETHSKEAMYFSGK